MTTIATDGKTMAADSRMGGDFTDQGSATKLFRIKGAVYGICGEFSSSLKYIDWVKGGRDKKNEPKLDDDWHAIFVNNGIVWHENNNLRPVKCGKPYAAGSGSNFAMGAMLAGATPAHAVKITMKLDPSTGGKVRTMKC